MHSEITKRTLPIISYLLVLLATLFLFQSCGEKKESREKQAKSEDKIARKIRHPSEVVKPLTDGEWKELNEKHERETIYLIPFGDVDEEILDAAKPYVEEDFNRKCVIGPRLPDLKDTLIYGKNQYAGRLYIWDLVKLDLPDAYRKIGYTNLDITLDGYNWAFSPTFNGGPCVISLPRMREEFYRRSPDKEKLIERAIKQTLRSLAISLNLECKIRQCSASPSLNVELIDKKEKAYCDTCSEEIKKKTDYNYAGAFYQRGNEYVTQNEDKEAVKEFKAAIKLEPECEKYYMELASTYYSNAYFDEAREIFSSLVGYNPNNADAYDWLGWVNYKMGDLKGAISAWEHALESEPKLKSSFGKTLKYAEDVIIGRAEPPEPATRDHREALFKVLCEVASENFHDGEYSSAAERYYSALKVKPDGREARLYLLASLDKGRIYGRYVKEAQRLIDEYPNCSEYLYYLAQAQRKKREYEEAIPIYLRAIDIDGEWGDVSLASCYFGIGKSYKGMQDYDQALTFFEKALEVDPGNIPSYQEIGWSNMTRKNYARAREAFRKGMEVAVEKEDDTARAEFLNALAGVSADKGNLKDAKGLWLESIELCRQIGNKEREGHARHNLGLLAYRLEDFSTAEQHITQALELFREADDERSFAQTLFDYGLVQYRYGNYPVALEIYHRAIEIAGEADYKWLEAMVLGDIGLVHYKMGELEKAGDYLGRSVRSFRTQKNKKDLAYVLAELGLVLTSEKKFLEASEVLSESLKIHREVGDLVGESETLDAMGHLYMSQGEGEKALEKFDEALSLAGETGINEVMWKSSLGKGMVLRDMGRHEEALKSFKQSIQCVERMRSLLQRPEVKASFVGDRIAPYLEAIKECMFLKMEDEAFNYLERAKARAFLDQLGVRELKLSQRRKKGGIEGLSNLRMKLALLDQELPFKKVEGFEELSLQRKGEIEEILEDYENTSGGLQKNDPELASLFIVNPNTIDEVKEKVNDFALLEFCVLDDYTLVWLIEDGESRVFKLPVSRSYLEEKIREGYQSLMKKDTERWKIISKDLFDKLMGPELASIKSSRICIVPHGMLHYLPFQALYNGDKYLIEDHSIFYSPSASVFAYCLSKRKASREKLIAFGYVSGGSIWGLLFVPEKEVNEIGKNFKDPVIYRSLEAKEKIAKEESGDYNVVHFSCHGAYNPFIPMASCLTLAPGDGEDGILYAEEVFGLDLEKTDMVVLSACESGVGALTNGDEFVSLYRGFIFAGSPSVVASLWRVDSDATTRLMTRFYKHLKTDDKATALARAQRDMLKEKPDPFYWAAFNLIGDWN